MSNNNREQQREKLLKLMRDIVAQDEALRQQFHIGDKFRFVRDRLHTLLVWVEESLTVLHQSKERKSRAVAEDEVLVYVYLYNAQGIVFSQWQKMFNQTAFYEYSVNRPIYAEESQVNAFIRTKSNKMQHGYLSVIVKKREVLQGTEMSQDAIGNPLIKVKEGSLRLDGLVSFMHNGQGYVLDDEGELVAVHNSTMPGVKR